VLATLSLPKKNMGPILPEAKEQTPIDAILTDCLSMVAGMNGDGPHGTATNNQILSYFP
jgi:hypothetical protein